MKTKNYARITALCAAIGLLTPATGCGSYEVDSQSITDELISNGFSLNGFSLNGFSLNGFSLNGFSLNGFSLNGFSLNGFSLNGFSLNGTTFSAVSSDGQPVAGLGFVGAQAQFTYQPDAQSQSVPYTIRFDNIYVDSANPNGDVYLYDISYVQGDSKTWQSLCLDGAGNPVAAIPIRNYWNSQTGARIDDPNAVTFACVSGALGKCVRIGYRPWAQANQCNKDGVCSPVSLTDHHQACTRMIRADYCGTGISYTVNGTVIDVFDGLTPQIQKESTTWPIEAQWAPGGATCLSDARHAELILAKRPPECARTTKLPSCSSRLPGALIGSKYDSAASK